MLAAAASSQSSKKGLSQTDGVTDKYKAAAEYVPQHDDEIVLSMGDIVTILHSYDDGWVLGKNDTTGAVGLLPRNFLVVIDDNLVKMESDDSQKNSSPLSAKPSVRTSSFISPTGKGFDALVNNEKKYSWGLLDELTGQDVASGSNRKRTSLSGVNTKDQDKYSHLLKSKLEPTLEATPQHESTNKLNASALSHMDTVKSQSHTVHDKKKASPLNAKSKLTTLTKWKSSRAPVSSNIGTVKVAVVGDSQIGKSALIQSLLTMPECIETEFFTLQHSNIVFEHRASTIPSDLAYSNEDRFNLTLVDTVGYGKSTDAALTIRPLVEYHLSQFQKTDAIFAKTAPGLQVAKFLNSGTGSHSHVDICLFGILHRLKPVDVEYIRVLSPYTCVMPVLLKSDTLSANDMFKLKVNVLETLMKSGVSIYGFGLSMEDMLELAKAQVMDAPPYAISAPSVSPSVRFTGQDSLNEFETLKQSVFFNFTDEIRNVGADKFVSWRNKSRKN